MKTREEAERRLHEIKEREWWEDFGVGLTPECKVWCVVKYRPGYPPLVVAS